MILPKPQRLGRHEHDGAFRLTGTTSIRFDAASAPAADALRRALRPATGFALPDADGGQAAITLSVAPRALDAEAYELTVTSDHITITGGDPAGVFYGVQSLRQLLPAEVFSATAVERDWTVPAVSVTDGPQLGWRGMMLDAARHFMPKEFILRLIDLLALHKLNVLHLHLTEDQGWRLAIEKYPRLTEVGAWRPETLVGHADRPEDEYTFDGTPHGGFYTQDDIREIVAYAAERFITVIPEIDMPGHMLAAITAYPELGNGLRPPQVWTIWGISEQVLNVDDLALDFCRDVLTEVMSLFPSRLIHCGGDECPKEEWRASPAAQARMRSLGLTDEDALQAWFTGQMATFLSDNGRRFIGWDEVLEGGGPANLPKDIVVMSWRGEEAGIEAARGGLDVVMAPCEYLYFDRYQSEDHDREPLAISGFVPLSKVYDYRPVPAALADEPEAARHVLGAQCQLWTEYVPTPKHAEYMLFPRLCAFAEAVWRNDGNGVDDFADFVTDRLRPHLERLNALGVSHRALD
ncbi:beta-N-acetylhexosaminidase [Streptomyces sp. NPDC013157]|uniref:beta-N-acetylhexosaminidase n=1 Tax=Streptomyces sp. NPDC013157 TaxID=3364861 RepID=UPI0036B21BFF